MNDAQQKLKFYEKEVESKVSLTSRQSLEFNELKVELKRVNE